MTSAATRSESNKDAVESLEARILDAALVRFGAVGVKKTTIEDVAREAGVDRVTVYRRMGSRDELVQAVVSREVAGVLADLAELPERHDTIDDLVADVLVTIVGRWRTHELAQRMVQLEPERVVMKLTLDGATAFTMSVMATASALEAAAARGLLPRYDDLLERAELLCRIVHSLVLVPGITQLDTDEQLDAFARARLVPIVTR